jgi:hypothetical protein
MAATAAGRRITEAHHLQQQQVQDGFTAEFLSLWALLDLARPDVTGDAWVRAVMTLLRQYRRRSVELAEEYARAYRLAELPGSDPLPPSLVDPPAPPAPDAPARETEEEIVAELDAAAERSLQLMGPLNVANRIRQAQPPERIERAVLVQASGSAARHVAAGGRQRTMRVIRDDDQIEGYIRVTREDPCSFCAMLASRGPVYKNEFTAGRVSNRRDTNTDGDVRGQFVGSGEFKVHDHCRCWVEPVYVDTPRELWPGRAAEFQDLWYATTEEYSGWDKAKAFRRVYEQLQRDARELAAAA